MFVLILIADPDSSKKSVLLTTLLFQKLDQEHNQKWKTSKKEGKFNFVHFYWFLVFLIMFPLEFSKNMTSLCEYLSKRNLILQSELQINEFENLTPQRGRVHFVDQKGPRFARNWYFWGHNGISQPKISLGYYWPLTASKTKSVHYYEDS